MASTLAVDRHTVQLLGQRCQEPTSAASAEPVPLPLLGWIVKANVVGSISHVTLSQCFHNSHSDPLEITYCFPLIDGSTVCGFRLEYESGAVINGVVKERDHAVKEFVAAKKSKLKAGLLERDRPDVFKLSLGLLAAGEHVRIDVTYISILKIENDDICFVFPTSIAPLYCPIARKQISVDPFASTVMFVGQHVEVSFRTMSPIISLLCPSHQDLVSINISGSSAIVAMPNVSRGADVILLCKEERSREPRALLEVGPDDSVVGLVMLTPKVESVEARAQEFVFIVDRSGSMDGERVNQAKEALKLFLRGLPVDSAFDIISFGSEFTSLFGESRRYNDDTLEAASKHASGLEADMGGTEILQPLQHVLSKPLPDGRVRNVFLLTDGEVTNAEEVFAAVEAAAGRGAAAPGLATGQAAAGPGKAQGQTRVFALGIGDTVSHRLVNGIARAGRGTARFVRSGQDMRGPVLEQLKQAMQPALDHVVVTWNFADSEQPLATQPKGGSAVGLVQQLVPSRPHAVFAGERFLSFAIFAQAVTPTGPLPQSVTVTAWQASSSALLSTTITLAEGDMCRGAVVHKLAAREAIRELEDGSATGGAAGECAAITRLAIAHGLVSSTTALVAVDAATARAVSTTGARTEVGQAEIAGEDCDFRSHGHSRLFSSFRPQSRGIEFFFGGPRGPRLQSRAVDMKDLDGSVLSGSKSPRNDLHGGGRKTDADGAARLCLLQRADGRFSAGAALDSAVGLAPDAALALRAEAEASCGLFGSGGTAAGGDEDSVWATVLAVAGLRTWFLGVRAVWDLTEAKALEALARMCAGAGAGSAEVEEGVAVVCVLLQERGEHEGQAGWPWGTRSGKLEGCVRRSCVVG